MNNRRTRSLGLARGEGVKPPSDSLARMKRSMGLKALPAPPGRLGMSTVPIGWRDHQSYPARRAVE